MGVAVSWCGSGRQSWWFPKPGTGSVQRNFLLKWVVKFICLWNIALVSLYPVLWRIWVSAGVRCMQDTEQSSPIPKWCPVLVSSIPSAPSACTSCCCSGRAREQRGWSWLWCFMSLPTSLNRLPSFETRARSHCPRSRQLFRWSSTFWKHSPQSPWVIYLPFSQPERGARDARHGNLPLELGVEQGEVWVLAIVWLLFTWRWVGDVGSDTSVFVPEAATSQQCLAALSWRRKIYIKQKAVKGCVFIDRRQSWDVLCQLSTSILWMPLEGEVEELQPLETQTLCGSVCVFAIKIGTWEPLCLGKK